MKTQNDYEIVICATSGQSGTLGDCANVMELKKKLFTRIALYIFPTVVFM